MQFFTIIILVIENHPSLFTNLIQFKLVFELNILKYRIKLQSFKSLIKCFVVRGILQKGWGRIQYAILSSGEYTLVYFPSRECRHRIWLKKISIYFSLFHGLLIKDFQWFSKNYQVKSNSKIFLEYFGQFLLSSLRLLVSF